MEAEAFLRLPAVMQRVGYSKSRIYGLIAQGQFPKQIQIGQRATAWRASEIDSLDAVSHQRKPGVAMSEILKRLYATGKQVIVVSDLIGAGTFPGMSPQGVYIRLAKLPVGERPVDWGAVVAGGRIAWMNPEAAAEFADHHIAYWEARVAAR